LVKSTTPGTHALRRCQALPKHLIEGGAWAARPSPRCFQRASIFSKASSCGIARACLSGILSPLPQTTSPSGHFVGPRGEQSPRFAPRDKPAYMPSSPLLSTPAGSGVWTAVTVARVQAKLAMAAI
jgi:hypothetical protein